MKNWDVQKRIVAGVQDIKDLSFAIGSKWVVGPSSHYSRVHLKQDVKARLGRGADTKVASVN
jgi:hypothetical protein